MHRFRRALGVGMVALATFVAGDVRAQQIITPEENPTAQDIEKAKQAMEAGVALMQDPDGARYEEAYPQFREAYLHSGSLNALQNLAICAMKLELDGEAVAYFKTVLAKKGDKLSDTDRVQIEKDITRLEATLAWITLEAAAGTTVTDERIPNRGAPVRNKYTVEGEPLKIGVRPGSHTFTATNAEGETSTWKVDIVKGSDQSHAFTFDGTGDEPDPDPIPDADEGGIPLPVWIVGGVTVAAGITFGALAGVASSKRSDYEDNLFEQGTLDEQQDAFDEVSTFNLAADVMLGVTVAGAATTLVLALVLPSSSEEEEAATATFRYGRDLAIAPAVGPATQGLSLTGRF